MHWGRKWQPTPDSLPGESQGRGSLVGCGLRGRTEATYQQQHGVRKWSSLFLFPVSVQFSQDRLLLFFEMFIYLAATSLSGSTSDLQWSSHHVESLVAACDLFTAVCVWDLVP